MSKQAKAGKADVRQTIRKVSEEVSKWPQWKRGGSAAAVKASAPAGSKKQQAG